ncbi:hypothetical protein ACFO8O_13190 [Hephaestia sp. GCM10023244]|uniref:hypothetical protein n=1 Tax=unclassified Hephaestia TaxID=2631281 RepID=UPI0020771F1E|nr:hypothetical protein [Hephaestia sp. MAHUQ-44]MCM8731916.1 hypothetical protein [Hephaestia sp. MAHUQ-44]
MRKILIVPIALLPLFAGGCLVKTAANVVTAPVRAGSQVVDWTTTSQDEADRNYGREMRKQEAKEGRARKQREKQCRKRPETCQGPYDGYRAGSGD